MKVQTYNILRNKNDLQDMLSDVQDIIDLGLYQTPEQTSFPTDSPTEGEARIVTSSPPILAYFVNGKWSYIQLGSKIEQSGWDYITETANPDVLKAITFPITFSSTPLVFVSYIGSRLISDGTPTGPGWFTGALTLRYAIGYGASASGFTAGIVNSANGNLGTTNYSAFSWRAIL